MRALLLCGLMCCAVPSAKDVRLASYGAEQLKCIDDNNSADAARACILAVRAKFSKQLDGGHE